ncbi:MAG: aspartate-semialdehyde dehydrogenase [Clostridia bacterium]|jgi:aspartate-semialdehyde dehydrogenase|nr:aspartate-semialdehyde dehydrogenase [Clostridia bacterium]
MNLDKKYKLAVVGATGLVGSTVLKVLEEKNLPILEYEFFASERSCGKTISFMGKDYIVKKLDESSFNNHFDFAIFSAGGDTSKKYSPIAAKSGCVVIDNSSAFRMDPCVPLVVPEVNSEEIFKHNGIIANPNCSTIQAVVSLKPLDDRYNIKRVIYSTYQAVSGAGWKGILDLENGSKGLEPQKFNYPIFNNCLPQIDVFLDNGYTKEEEKMINETRKILKKPDLKITATTVRVPVINCHSESINIEFEKNFDLEELKNILQNAPGIILQDDIKNCIYPLPTKVSNHDEVYVGRIRRDYSVTNGINLWVVADNIRKGAASNAVQIVEKLIFKN